MALGWVGLRNGLRLWTPLLDLGLLYVLVGYTPAPQSWGALAYVWLAGQAVVSTSSRPERSLPRYGGDEFVVVSELDGLESRLRSAFADPLRTRHGVLEIGVDVGVTAWRRGLALADILAEADRRMYASKRAGRAQRGLPRTSIPLTSSMSRTTAAMSWSP